MAWLLAISLLALAGSLFERRRRDSPPLSLEDALVQTGRFVVLVGLVGVSLAAFGAFRPQLLAPAFALAALGLWPWKRPRPPRVLETGAPNAWPLLFVIGVGIALRAPSFPAPLAGRDQGSYALRAQQLARTGSYTQTNVVLARAGHERQARSGPQDLLGLYSKNTAAERQGAYEAAYRPGQYLADLEGGTIVPQFLHAHPTLLAVAHLVSGGSFTAVALWLEYLLGALAFALVAQRVFPQRRWSLLALCLYVSSPLLVWVQRVPLTESLTGAMLWLALLSGIRSREKRPGADFDVGLFLGFAAWVHGNLWMTLPPMLALLWLRPREPGHSRGPLALALLLVLSVALHAFTVYPYLHDELLRQLPWSLTPTPSQVAGAALAGAAAWWGLDLLWRRFLNDTTRQKLVGQIPRLLALALGVGWGLYIYLYITAPTDRPPYARLDAFAPSLGRLWLLLAVPSALAVLWRWRAHPRDLWLVCIASSAPLTCLIYAQRNLPHIYLYYYGRYLAPFLLPASLLVLVALVRSLDRRFFSRFPQFGRGMTVALSVALFAGQAGIFLSDPVTRLVEFKEAGRLVKGLSRELPDGAVVIAGGEGWHHGHTFRQVAGALEFRRDITVLPYRNREAAYSTLYELMVAGPSARHEDPPTVYLLLNEASKRISDTQGRPLAGIDDALPAPFQVSETLFTELFVDSLSRTKERPTRITRHELRMALMKVEVAPWRQHRSQHFALRGDVERLGLELGGGQWKNGNYCLLRGRTAYVRLPPLRRGAGQLVVVATPGTSRLNHRWKVKADKRTLASFAAGKPIYHRDTLGPFSLPTPPKRIELRGRERPVKSAPCPFGGIAQLRWLPAEHSSVAQAGAYTRTLTFLPEANHTHPVRTSTWVSARSFSAYRPGIRPKPKLSRLSLLLDPKHPRLIFRPAFVPRPATARNSPVSYDLSLTLTAARAQEDLRLMVEVGPGLVLEFDPPDHLDRAWTAPPVPIELEQDLVGLRVTTNRALMKKERILIRDLALFRQSPRERPGNDELPE